MPSLDLAAENLGLRSGRCSITRLPTRRSGRPSLAFKVPARRRGAPRASTGTASGGRGAAASHSRARCAQLLGSPVNSSRADIAADRSATASRDRQRASFHSASLSSGTLVGREASDLCNGSTCVSALSVAQEAVPLTCPCHTRCSIRAPSGRAEYPEQPDHLC